MDAGEVITVSSPAGTFATLELISAFGFTFYDTETEITAPLPSGLTVDIPGGQFPAFANVSIPDVSPLTGASPGINQAITAGTTFSWDAGNNPEALVLIDADDVSCVVTDDGSFTMPASIQAQLPGNFGAFGYDISRIAVRFLQSGTAVLVVTSVSEG